MTETKPLKVYVGVQCRFDAFGGMRPQEITWEDGTRYEVDRVTDIRPAPALRAGGQGDRYTIYIAGKQSYLYFERSYTLTGNYLGRWFVERKVVWCFSERRKRMLSKHLKHRNIKTLNYIVAQVLAEN